MCDTDGHFDMNSAHAICRQMGYTRAGRWTSGLFNSAQNNYKVTLDNVECKNMNFNECSYDHEVSDCNHNHDVYLDCGMYCQISTIHKLALFHCIIKLLDNRANGPR